MNNSVLKRACSYKEVKVNGLWRAKVLNVVKSIIRYSPGFQSKNEVFRWVEQNYPELSVYLKCRNGKLSDIQFELVEGLMKGIFDVKNGKVGCIDVFTKTKKTDELGYIDTFLQNRYHLKTEDKNEKAKS